MASRVTKDPLTVSAMHGVASTVLRSSDWFHPDGFPIHVERREPQPPFPLHSHEFSELVIVTGGAGLHVTGHEAWPLSAGDVFVIGGERPHTYERRERLALINILFRPEALRMDKIDLASLPGYHVLFTLEPTWRRRHRFNSRLRLSPSELAVVLERVDELEQELKRRDPGFGFLATAAFMRLVGYLSRCVDRARDSDSRALLRIGQAMSYIETHLGEAVHLDTLASIARMSKRSFIRTFRAAMGSSPISYLIKLRINRAAQQLRRGDDSITDIAFNAGFSDSNYFSRQFRAAFGVSPRAYRRQHPPSM